MSNPTLSKKELFDSLPPLPSGDFRQRVATTMETHAYSIIVLDDDPTGTQTVHGIPVLTEWSEEVITQELAAETPLFYILTNSRSLIPSKAVALANLIGHNISAAIHQTGRRCLIISRSDSTLRGHYPDEVDGLLESLGKPEASRFLIPAFFDGGRVTYQNIHYVLDGDRFIPADETPYAKDVVFGYSNAHMKAYVEEKTQGRVKEEEVASISIEELRTQSLSSLTDKIEGLPPGSTCIVNAADIQDLSLFSLALLQAKTPSICRTAASFVPAIAGLAPKPLLDPASLGLPNGKGKLVVVGSHVPMSSKQLAHLLQQPHAVGIELQLDKLLPHNPISEAFKRITKQMNSALSKDELVIVYTQRTVLTAPDSAGNLSISEQVSNLLCAVVSEVQQAPRFLLAKGGITSSDVATKSLGIKKALVEGQVFAGVPLWKTGSESRFPGMPYIVFPGNVGVEDTISKIVFA